jgi:hypothetical protein
MVRLNVTMKSAFLSAMLILWVFGAYVLPSFAQGRIHIIGIDPSSASANSSVRVYGSGATPSGVVTAMLGTSLSNETFIVGNSTFPFIILDSNDLILGSTLASESGDWSISFVIPNVLPGYYNVYVLDNASQASDSVSFLVPINATGIIFPINATGIIFVNETTGLPPGLLQFFVNGTAVPSSGPSGAWVSMSGHHASGGEIEVYFDNSLVATVVGQQGDWSASFQVPNVLIGNHTIRAIDLGGRWMSAVAFDVTSPSIGFSMFSTSMSSLSLLSLFAGAVLLGVTLFMLLATYYGKQKQQKEC